MNVEECKRCKWFDGIICCNEKDSCTYELDKDLGKPILPEGISNLYDW